jgi:hypothetical protein
MGMSGGGPVKDTHQTAAPTTPHQAGQQLSIFLYRKNLREGAAKRHILSISCERAHRKVVETVGSAPKNLVVGSGLFLLSRKTSYDIRLGPAGADLTTTGKYAGYEKSRFLRYRKIDTGSLIWLSRDRGADTFVCGASTLRGA